MAFFCSTIFLGLNKIRESYNRGIAWSNLGRTKEAKASFKQAEALQLNNQLYHVRSGLRSFTGGFGLVLLVEMTLLSAIAVSSFAPLA